MSLSPNVTQAILQGLERGATVAGESSAGDERFIASLLNALLPELDENARNEAFAMAAMSPSPVIRIALIEAASHNLDWPVSKEYLAWALEDYSDVTALAVDNALAPGQHVPINFVVGMSGSGRPLSNVLSFSLRDIVAEARADSVPGYPSTYLPTAVPNLDGMIEVPAGTWVLGADSTMVRPNAWFSLELNPLREVNLPRFWIDRDPVTNQAYDDFCAEISEHGHLYCHPDEPPNKWHRRSTCGDARFGPDHPVCGIDWYDAIAYARFFGKQLPTINQWERAALDLSPWANPQAPQGQGAFRAFGKVFQTMKDWKDTVRTVTNSYPVTTTVPVSDPVNPVTKEGVRGLIGNVWEMTRSRFLDGEDVVPMYRHLDSNSIIEDWTAWIAIKGGAWTSVGELLHPRFTGRRFLLHRSLDVGFRCVAESE